MLQGLIVRALNHALQSEHWARERLHKFAGNVLQVVAAPFDITLAISPDGLFKTPESGAVPAVRIELPADTPLRLLTDRNSAFAAARITGPADLAEALAFVFRHVRWDVEDDLAKVVGDIPARRLAMAGRAFVDWHRRALANLSGNAAEYLAEESGMLMPRREFERFRHELARTREEAERLEERLGRL